MRNSVHVRLVTHAKQRERAFDIRRRVFQDEQHVPAEEEFDTDDDRATHVLADISGAPVGTGRIVFHPTYAKIGRMAVLSEWRRHGVGRAIMEKLLHIARDRRVTRVVLHAQVHAIGFYEAVGFRVAGDQFQEAGIPHRRMQRSLTA